MVRVAGFEPAASRFQIENSNQTELHPRYKDAMPDTFCVEVPFTQIASVSVNPSRVTTAPAGRMNPLLPLVAEVEIVTSPLPVGLEIVKGLP
jgi:hypothetical protein